MSPKEKASSLPAVLSEDISFVPTTYRAGMYAELQKFGSPRSERQLLLSEAGVGSQELEAWIEVAGLDFTETQDRAWSALQILLDKTDYKGNMPGQPADSQAYQWRGTLPRLAITYSDYFGAYGLDRIDGRYQGLQRDEALRALESLTETRRIAYRRRLYMGQGKNRRQKSQVIVHKGPLVTLTEGYKELEEEEASEIMAGQDKPGRVTHLVIDFSPLIVDGIEDRFYLLKPTTLHQDIKEIAARKRGKKARTSRVYSQFAELLLTVNIPNWPIGKDKLIGKLTSLDGYVRQRKWSRVDELLQEAFEIALEYKLLLSWRLDLFDTYHFELNRAKMGRPPKYGPKKEAEDGQEPS